jgi:membrane protease YdiL (CAAX protease family)
LIYIIVTKNFSFSEWIDNLKKGKKFWIPVVLTVIFLAIAFSITMFLQSVFPQIDDGSINLKSKGRLGIFLFALSTIFLPPITEECFFRKNLIFFNSKTAIITSTLFSMFLYAWEHALTPWGIFLSMIWAVPFSLSYIKTRNIYITITAHFITNLIVNGLDTVFMIFSL